MKFNLLFKTDDPQQTQRLNELVQDHLKTHDCEKCSIKDTCPIPGAKIGVESWASTSGDDFAEIKELIKSIYSTSCFILLIDNPKDICFIYKAKGNVKEIKGTMLKEATEIYKRFHQTDIFFSEIVDLRGIPLDVKGNGTKLLLMKRVSDLDTLFLFGFRFGSRPQSLTHAVRGRRAGMTKRWNDDYTIS